MSFSNYLSTNFERVKAESAILKDDRTAWQKFWEEYGSFVIGIALVVAVILFVVATLLWEQYSEKRKEKLSKTTTTYDGIAIATYKTCTISLVNYDTITLVKGSKYAAPFPEKQGYFFAGWFYDTAFTKPYQTTKISKDIVLYPKWTKES